MKEHTSIWQKPIYLPYLQPELTEKAIKDAEQKLGYTLPNELIELLQIQNGGYIKKRLKEWLHDQIYGIGPHFPSITDVDWTEYKGWVSFELEGLIPFDGDGHWHICLDYRNHTATPEITYIDTETDKQRKIAGSFSDYLSLLTLEVEGLLAINTDQPIKEVVKNLESVWHITFEEPSSFNHGYDQYRGRLNNAWVWLSPNLVPNGFVRENEDRYEELIKLAKGKALRFPEIPETSLLLSFSDIYTQKLAVRMLRDNGMNLVSLEEML